MRARALEFNDSSLKNIFGCGILMLIRFNVRSTVVYSIAHTTRELIGTLFPYQKKKPKQNSIKKCLRKENSIKNAAILDLFLSYLPSPLSVVSRCSEENRRRRRRSSKIQSSSHDIFVFNQLFFPLRICPSHRPLLAWWALPFTGSNHSTANVWKHNSIKYSSA